MRFALHIALVAALGISGRASAADSGFIGVVMAPATVDLASQLESRVKRMRVRAGDAVHAGDVLAELDTTAARQELAIANAELWSARAELRRAQLEAREAGERLGRRTGTVTLSGGRTVSTVSEEELTGARYQEQLAGVKIDAARAAVLEKRARSEGLRVLAAEGELRAPFDGLISERFVDEGALVRKGGPIVRLIETSGLKVRFAIPELAARQVRVGASIRVDADGLELAGVVEKVAPEVDAAARLVFAEATLTVPESERAQVRSGSVARVVLR